jgi:heme-binding protein
MEISKPRIPSRAPAVDAGAVSGLSRQLRRALLAVLVIVAIASAARPRPRPMGQGDSAAPLNGRTPVPAPAMSALRRACFDCHSQETRWPWYASLPIASRLIERDVKAARGQLDLSRWTQYNRFDRADLLDKMCQLASTEKMPPWSYRVMHADARLTASDVAALCAWTQDEATHLIQEDR